MQIRLRDFFHFVQLDISCLSENVHARSETTTKASSRDEKIPHSLNTETGARWSGLHEIFNSAPERRRQATFCHCFLKLRYLHRASRLRSDMRLPSDIFLTPFDSPIAALGWRCSSPVVGSTESSTVAEQRLNCLRYVAGPSQDGYQHHFVPRKDPSVV